MDFLESSFNGKNQFWRYLLLILIMYAAIQIIGGLPILISYLIKQSNGEFITATTSLEMMIFAFIVGIVAIAILVKPIHNRTIGQLINGGNRFRWNKFFKGYLVWFGMSAIYLSICFIVFPNDFELNNLSVTLIRVIIVSLFLMPFQAAFEEILTRGYFMQGFYVLTRKKWLAILFTSIIFALLHCFNPEVKEFGFFTAMAQYLLFGLLFGVVAVFDNGIETTIGLHSANNAFLCIMVTNESFALQTDAVFKQTTAHPWFDFGIVTILSVITVFILFPQILVKTKHLNGTA